MLGGSDLIYAVFNSEEEFHGPIFKSIDKAGDYVSNNKTMIIPMKEKNKVYMNL